MVSSGDNEETKAASQDADDQPVDGRYVYCIIQSETPHTFGNLGIGGRKDLVYTLHYERLAAVVSSSPVVVYDPTRDNVMAHEGVNEVAMREFTVIPMSFGTVFRTDEDVIEFLRHTSGALEDVLQKMKDKIEFGLKVSWDPELVLQEVEEEREDIRLLKEQIASNRQGSTYFARMQLGRLVEQALAEKADAYVREIYDDLRSDAVASRHNKPIGEKMILNAAFLVDRNNTVQFEERVREIAQRRESKLRFGFSGPWPPYNFVNIRLKLEAAGGVHS